MSATSPITDVPRSRLPWADVAAELEQARRSTSVSQERLAEIYRGASGDATTNRTVVNWLRGIREPKFSQFQLLSQLLNEILRAEGKPMLPFGIVTDIKETPSEEGVSKTAVGSADGSEDQMS